MPIHPAEVLSLPAQRIEVVGVAWCGIPAGNNMATVASIVLPEVGDGAFAVELRGGSLGPDVSSGDIAVAKPGTPLAGDLVVITRTDGRMLLKRWKQGDGERITLTSSDGDQSIEASDVAAVAIVHIVVKRVHRGMA